MAVTEFKLPDIGEGVAEGEITSWKVKAGEDVVEDQVMVEVMTDKATVEIGSPVTGKIVELKAGEGDVVPVGEVIVVLEEGVPSVEAADEAPPVEEPVAPKEPAPPPAVSQELDLFTDEPPVQREAPPPPPPPPPPATVVVPEEAPPAVEEPIEEAPSSDLGEVHFTLPDVGEGVAEGEITKWIVSEGDAVVEDQPMLEVMTDKATVEIGSPVNGRVQEILRKEGETVPVGDVLLVLAADGEGPATQDDVGDSKSPPHELEQDNSPVVATASRSAPEQRASGAVARRVRAAPAVRRLAREMELEIGLLEGSGPQGRVTMDDVRAASVATTAVAEPTVVQPQSAEVEPAPAPSEPDLSEKSEEATKPVVALSVDGPRPHDLPGDRREPLRGLRRRIANSMRTARRVAAHFTYCEEIDVTELILLREAAKKRVLKKTGAKLSYMPFLVKAILPALEE
ncbi:MAG: biotin/lipoyl-containing protein, partial [Planctomycetota bacterium]|nr:biotin/lipoyl-containing protein [Planctomycetota bacterium]